MNFPSLAEVEHLVVLFASVECPLLIIFLDCWDQPLFSQLINRPLCSTTNLVCLYSLDAIDNRMQEKLNSCDVNDNDAQIALSWRYDKPLCTRFSVSYI